MPALLNVHWLVPVGIYVVVAFIGVRWLQKHLANQPDQTKRLFTNFGFCAAIAALFAGFTGHLRFDAGTLAVFCIGVVNGVAIIAQWRATRTSLSKTSLLSFGDDIIAVLLSIVIINDGKYLNGLGATGMTLCLLAGVLFWWHGSKQKEREANAFYLQVLVYSVLWGIAIFAQRYYAFNEMPVAQFLFAWYAGSFVLMSAVLAFEHNKKTGKGAAAFSLKDYAWVALFAVGILFCLGVEYWAFMLAPQTAVTPVLLAAEAVLPAIVGWTIFKEGRHFDRWQWSFSAIAIAGVLLLAVSIPYNIK
jgi:hypothetical protein